jgi:K(+)-stimulated pyrophosphate-energized sodium pump
VTVLGLIVVLYSSGLLFALGLASSILRRESGVGELQRLGSALGRAADGFVAQEVRLIALATAVLGPLVFTLHAVVLKHGAGLGGLESAFWATVGLCIGAGATCVVARIGAKVAVNATVRSLGAAQRSLDRALGVGIRAGGAVALLVESLSALGILLVFGLLFAIKGGFGLGDAQQADLALAIAMLLPTFALGSALATLVLQRGGATYHLASDTAADLAGERDAGLEHDDAKNPAVIADLVGDQVGAVAGRGADTFLTTTTANVAAIVIAAGVFQQALAPLGARAALGLALIPLVVRGFGLVASMTGVMVVRTLEAERQEIALWRGQATTILVASGAFAGTALWLLGEPHYTRFVWAALLGLGAATLGAHLSRWRVTRRSGAPKDATDSLRTGEAPGVAEGLGAGLETAAIPLVCIAVAMAGAYELGATTNLPLGGLVATLVAVMAILAVSPYVLAITLAGAVADATRGIGSMSPTTSDAQRRTQRIDDAAFTAGAMARSYLIVPGCLSALLGASALASFASPTTAAIAVDFGKPAVIWSGVLGFAVVLAYVGNTLRASSQGARGVAQEVERQLRGFPRDRGRPVVPSEFTPSYRACVELTSKAALAGILLPVALALVAPALLGILLRFAFRSDAALPTQGLAAFVSIAAMTGLCLGLAIDGARATLSAARRGSRPSTAGFASAIGGEALGDAFGNAAGPAAHVLVKAVAIVALAVAPFLTIQP